MKLFILIYLISSLILLVYANAHDHDHASTTNIKLGYQILDTSRTDNEFKIKLSESELLSKEKNACQGGIDSQLIANAMRKGFFESVMKIVEACSNVNIIFDKSLPNSAANDMRQKISKVMSLLQSASKSESIVAPAFEWAQSSESIFLGVKFAHKLDAPACIDLVDEKLKIKEKQISLNITCNGKNKKFGLTLNLFDEIDTDRSFWNIASVGRGTFTLFKKKTNTKWERLLSTKTKPRNMHTWWSLQEKYENELEVIESKNKEDSSIEKTTVEKVEPTQNTEESKTEIKQEEKDEKETALELRIKELKKRAKIDSKRINKEIKKEIKSMDKDLKNKLEEIKKEHEEEVKNLEKKFEEEKEKLTENKKSRLNQIKKGLEESIKKAEEGT